jgi:hypothetical protein
MKFDDLGFPKVSGADDWQDSPHLAGILEFVDHPQKVDGTMYVFGRKYVRHPRERMYDVSRDQAILLMYCLYKQGRSDLVDLSFIDGRDIMSPAVRGFVRIMKGGKPYPWETWWFNRELETNWELQKLEEPFQIIVMCDVYGVEYLRRWTNANKLWRWAIRRYLCQLDGAWRGEPELAELVIQTIERRIA